MSDANLDDLHRRLGLTPLPTVRPPTLVVQRPPCDHLGEWTGALCKD